MAIIIRTFDIFQISFTFVEFSLKINILLSVAGNSCVRGNLLGYKMDRPDQNRPQLHPANVFERCRSPGRDELLHNVDNPDMFGPFMWIKAAEFTHLHPLREAMCIFY